jgi:subtilisin family serine protease
VRTLEEERTLPNANRELLALVRLEELMARTAGRPEVTIGLIDGPLARDHPDLDSQKLRFVGSPAGATCGGAGDAACSHGTFVAGILAARRGSQAPALCPDCTLLVRPIFNLKARGASPQDLAAAIRDCIAAGARILNLSLGVLHATAQEERALQEGIDHAARRGVLMVAAAGNEGSVGGSVLTRHPWVVPVVACDRSGRPVGFSNLGRSIGHHGLRAPGESVQSLGADGSLQISGGTSVATPFVTGTLALLASSFPRAHAVVLRSAVAAVTARRGTSLVPRLLDAQTAYQRLARF